MKMTEKIIIELTKTICASLAIIIITLTPFTIHISGLITMPWWVCISPIWLFFLFLMMIASYRMIDGS